MSLDDIIREQEEEAKRTAADRKRRDLEKKSRDPLQLAYIQQRPEDIFVNPQQAAKAGLIGNDAKSLEDIMREQGANKGKKK